MSEVQTVEERLTALEKKIDSFAAEHAEFRAVHVSRRGVTGPAGPKGESIQGPKGDPGRDGKDADLREAVYLAEEEMHAVLDEVLKNLPEVILFELKRRGFLDETGRAIPGPAGAPSQVPGPKGDSIIGPAGRDGVDGKPAKIAIGSVTSGPTASVTVREEGGVHILDFIIPRGEKGRDGLDSTVAGPAGRDGLDSQVPGPEGLQGIPGKVDKRAVAEIILEMKKRGSI